HGEPGGGRVFRPFVVTAEADPPVTGDGDPHEEHQEGGDAEDVEPAEILLEPIGRGGERRRHRGNADERPNDEGEDDGHGRPEHRRVGAELEAPAGGDIPRWPRLSVGVVDGLGHVYHLRRLIRLIDSSSRTSRKQMPLNQRCITCTCLRAAPPAYRYVTRPVCAGWDRSRCSGTTRTVRAHLPGRADGTDTG